MDSAKPVIHLFLFLSLVCCFAGCYEPMEGCLDVRATNFDLNADRPCIDNCCEYPELQLKLLHRYQQIDTLVDIRFQDSAYVDDSRQAFRFNEVLLYISELELIQPDGQSIGILDTIEIANEQDNGDTLYTTISDNFALYSGNFPSTLSLGQFDQPKDFIGLSFQLGLAPPASESLPAFFPDNHPLSVRDSSMLLEEGGYVDYRLSLFRDTIATDTIPVELILGPAIERRIFLDFDTTIGIIEGFDIEISIQIDYSKLFQGIDIRNDSEEVMKAKIVDQFTEEVFDIVEVLLKAG